MMEDPVMSVDAVRPAFGVPVVHPKQDADEQSSSDPRRGGKPGQSGREQQDQPSAFLNSLGEITGKTINVIA
jgi:hypothetical protein